jgi:hypothetical protein
MLCLIYMSFQAAICMGRKPSETSSRVCFVLPLVKVERCPKDDLGKSFFEYLNKNSVFDLAAF